jgi:hypothetical protein
VRVAAPVARHDVLIVAGAGQKAEPSSEGDASVHTGHDMLEQSQLVGSIGVATMGLAFVSGVLIRLAGGVLHRPFWKAGARLSYAAIAGLALVAGCYLLAVAVSFPPTGFGLWEALLVVGIGALWFTLGVVALRWVLRHDFPDATWQRPLGGKRWS